MYKDICIGFQFKLCILTLSTIYTPRNTSSISLDSDGSAAGSTRRELGLDLTAHSTRNHRSRSIQHISQSSLVGFCPTDNLTPILDQFWKDPTAPSPRPWSSKFMATLTIIVYDSFAGTNASRLRCYPAVCVSFPFPRNISLISKVVVDLQSVNSRKAEEIVVGGVGRPVAPL
jgi:hypothetical protein